MALANTNLRITELDFDSIKTNIKNYLKNQDQFTDYDFDGSGLSVLLDVLAYNTHYMGMYVNFIGNEMFLDTAQIRASLLSLAKLTNYVPTSRRGSVSTVNITVTPGEAEDGNLASLVLPQYTRFFGTPVDGVSYVFVNTDAYISSKANGIFQFSGINLKQGEYSEQIYTVTTENDKRRFTIPTTSLDTSTMVVVVQESEVDDTATVYNLAGDTNELTSDSTIYFLEESADANGYWTIYFGDGYIGKRLLDGNIVTVSYLDVVAEESNGSRDFTAIDGVGVFTDNVIVSTVDTASGGSEKESIEDIRFRAPIHYVTQNRSVTKNDYGVLLLKDYPYIESVAVWGGEENDPPMYGKIFVSLKPKENYSISLIEKERIKEEIIRSRSVLTVFPEIIDPDYTYIKVKTTVNYNPKLTSKTEDELKSIVRTAILNYRNDNLKQFNSVFRKSLLQRYIDTAERSIISDTTDIYLQKRFEPTLNASLNYKFDFKTILSKGDATNKLFTYPTYGSLDTEKIERTTYMEEYPLAFTGIDSISVTDPGYGYLTTPTVTIIGDGTGATAKAKIVNGKIASIAVVDRGINYTTATAVITGGSGFGGAARVNLQFRNGVLRSFYVKTNGEKIIINSNVGTIDYRLGKIELNTFEPTALINNEYYDPTILTLNIQPEDDVIYPVQNRILDIDQYDASAIQITMVPEN